MTKEDYARAALIVHTMAKLVIPILRFNDETPELGAREAFVRFFQASEQKDRFDVDSFRAACTPIRIKPSFIDEQEMNFENLEHG